jgi:hypothetical protein
MSSTTTTYLTKALFEATGYAPHLQPTSNPDRCGICLKDIACEAQVAVYKPLSEAERTFLDLFLHFPSKIQHTDILRLKKDQHHHTTHHHHEDEETGLRIKACGHIFGPTCIKEWFKGSKNCPMCRKQCFESNFSTSEELDAHFQEMEERFMREMVDVTPWNAQMGFF